MKNIYEMMFEVYKKESYKRLLEIQVLDKGGHAIISAGLLVKCKKDHTNITNGVTRHVKFGQEMTVRALSGDGKKTMVHLDPPPTQDGSPQHEYQYTIEEFEARFQED